ncbi:hypothetical protein TRFO_25183 [Tritrichomonas foetus]|uniref:PAS domain-containing protein n=1 Tax=Tritrichomonas foetus TaxID=1144522 RepID=A0A1J4K5C5_9EUKA|nr:hypothetical protein TRFO_25183 [Tritrichomonas foetus]|eukprot:OHT06657.1 hypothetical protein TRFO_25183 [Tritrichomonas foetus]
MAEVMPSFLNQKQTEIPKFPESFHFFSYMCSHPSSFLSFVRIFHIFLMAQFYMASFTPIINKIRSEQLDETILSNIFSILVHFTPFEKFRSIRSGEYDNIIILLSIILIVYFFIVYVHYRSFLSTVSFFQFFKHSRIFVLMPVPTIFILPICTSIAQNIGNETYLENRIHIQYIDFIVLVLILISIISFTLWIRPLYYYTPIFLESSIPSRLIPDDHFINFLLAKNFVIFLSLLLSSKLASIFFTIFSCFLNTLLYVDIFKVPFISPFDSAVAMSGLFVNTISTIFSCISIYFPIVFEYQDIFFYSSIPFFIIISLISYFVRNKIELKDPLCKCQQSVWKSTVDKENIDELEAEYVKYGNINDLLASIYCKLILKENDIKTLKQILNLMKGNTFSWPIKFVLFEFYKQCNQDKFSIDNDPQITEIKNEIFAYQDKIDLFWSNIIKGTLLEASQVNILLKKEQEQIRKKYWKLIRIYSQNVDLNSLGSKYLFLKNNDINNEIDLISRYKMFCSTKNIVDTMYYPTGSTTESSYETETDQQKKKVSQNIYRYAINQNLPFIDYVFLILSIILLLISFMLVSIPFQRLIQRASQFKNLPESIGKEVSIGADWGVLDYSLSHAISCTKYVDADHDDIMDLINGHHKPEHLSHVTIGHTVRLIDQIAINLMKNTVQFPNDIRTIAAQDILDYLEQIWLKPTVALYPHSSLIPLRQFRIDTISMINGYCGIVIKNFDGTVHPCQNPSVKEVKMIERDFYANSYTMKEIIMLCMDSSNQYVQKLLDINLTNHDFKFIAIYFLPFILTIFISTFLYFASFYGEYSLVKKYFRPSSHPNENIQVDFCQANEKFKLTHQYFTFSSFLIFMFIFTFLQMYLLLNYTNGAYRNVMNYCIFLSNLGNYSLNSITMLTGFIRRIQYPKNISLHRNLPRYYKGMELTLDHVYTSMIDISHTKSLKFLFDEYCDYHRFNSFHDSISCWSILRVMDLMNYWSNIHVLDTSSFCFDQIQHLIVSHGLPEIRRAITNTARIATLEITKVGFYAFLEILFLAFIGSFVIIVIVIYFLDINGRYAHIVSYLYFLNPAYVTKNRCFIDFLVNLDSKQTQEKYSQSYLKIFNSTNISLLILDRNLNILVGTASFFKDFGYQQQQLCGQSIDIIIPRHFQESNNNEKFYTNLNKIINKNSYIKKYSK